MEYTKAYTENLIASLQRTRDELNGAIRLLAGQDAATVETRTATDRLIRTVWSITEDLRG